MKTAFQWVTEANVQLTPHMHQLPRLGMWSNSSYASGPHVRNVELTTHMHLVPMLGMWS